MVELYLTGSIPVGDIFAQPAFLGAEDGVSYTLQRLRLHVELSRGSPMTKVVFYVGLIRIVLTSTRSSARVSYAQDCYAGTNDPNRGGFPVRGGVNLIIERRMAGVISGQSLRIVV
jgi:hypothetical protein